MEFLTIKKYPNKGDWLPLEESIPRSHVVLHLLTLDTLAKTGIHLINKSRRYIQETKTLYYKICEAFFSPISNINGVEANLSADSSCLLKYPFDLNHKNYASQLLIYHHFLPQVGRRGFSFGAETGPS